MDSYLSAEAIMEAADDGCTSAPAFRYMVHGCTSAPAFRYMVHDGITEYNTIVIICDERDWIQ